MARPTDSMTSSTHNGDPQAAEADVPDVTSEDDNDVEERDLESEQDSSGVAMFGAGLMLGLAVGAGLALLLAPQAGDETRRLIKRRAKRLGDHVSESVEDLRDDIRRSARRGEKRLRQRLNLS
jgi:hypothetical protein